MKEITTKCLLKMEREKLCVFSIDYTGYIALETKWLRSIIHRLDRWSISKTESHPLVN
jgi:hypothetical protein